MYSYPAIRYQQLPSASGSSETREIVCLVAPSDEILQWAGIPRKAAALVGSEAGDVVELHGYQREQNPARVRQLIKFFQSPENVIPTSILLARRFSESVSFKANAPAWDFGGIKAQPGVVEIVPPLSRDMPMRELFARLADILLSRHPPLEAIDMKTLPVGMWQERIVSAASEDERAVLTGVVPTTLSSTPEDAQETGATAQEDEADDGERSAVDPYSPDLHIEDFYREIRLRQILCERLPFLDKRDDVLGISRVTLLDYLAPVTVVDGQHRLLGSCEAVNRAAAEHLGTPEAQARVVAGESADEISREYVRQNRRIFSATLLLDSSWAEHVFQFVVVNQKVKPISKALLSSIISTSLSSHEIERIQDRLERAGIEIDDYRIMGILTESEKSPFKGLVRKGFRAESSDERQKLDWPVLNNLAADFRSMRGLVPYDRKVDGDVSILWKKKLLQSEMIQQHAKEAGLSAEEAWDHPLRGLWLRVFLAFWSKVRDTLADNTDPRTAWGADPAKSNIFNGATMRTMLADFVDYANDKDVPLSSPEDLEKTIDEYLGKLRTAFFNREWSFVGNRVDKTNMSTLAQYLRKHRKENRVDGNWKIFKSAK